MLTVGVIGQSSADNLMYEFAKQLGEQLALNDFNLVNGGLGGVMQATCEGFSSVINRKGRSICIIPNPEKNEANPFCDIVIPTGLGIARNLLVVRTADILVAIGGGSGTLSEIAFAWQLGKTVLCVQNFDGWAKKLANTQIDNRHSEKLLIPVNSVSQILNILQNFFK